MKYKLLNIIITAFTLCHSSVNAQFVKLNQNTVIPHQVSVQTTRIMGKEAIRIIKDSLIKNVDEPTFVRIKDLSFTNGTIEVKVLSRLLKNAPAQARGFIGVAFRIDEGNSKYESIYIRPTNGRADDQLRRNRTIQYYAYPDYKFDRLRNENPGQYESYSDMALNEWISIKIIVNEQEARLFINGAKHPSLIVKDLKHGGSTTGAIGLWVDVGTEGYFADLKILGQ